MTLISSLPWMCLRGCDGERKVVDTPRIRVADIRDLAGRLDVAGPLQELLEQDLDLQRHDVLADALVRSPAEADVRVLFSGEVEGVGLVEGSFVEIAGREQH